jgi:HD-like signal output (HDOD) protein
MTALSEQAIRQRVDCIEITPSIPAVLLPLVHLIEAPADEVDLNEVVRLVSYDSSVAAQCLRVAASPLFGQIQPPDTISKAVMGLGMRRVESILLTCCLGQAFPIKKWAIDPVTYWRHSLGCAMVCRKLSEKLVSSDGEKAYMAGLLHDVGFLVNCLAFSREFSLAMELAQKDQIPLVEAEHSAMGFTHCETGRALGERWKLNEDILDVIGHHHDTGPTGSFSGLVAMVHLCDLLCRMRGLGYGYYERQKVDLAHNPAWGILIQNHKELEGVDLVRFTFELDESMEEILSLVSLITGQASHL